MNSSNLPILQSRNEPNNSRIKETHVAVKKSLVLCSRGRDTAAESSRFSAREMHQLSNARRGTRRDTRGLAKSWANKSIFAPFNFLPFSFWGRIFRFLSMHSTVSLLQRKQRFCGDLKSIFHVNEVSFREIEISNSFPSYPFLFTLHFRNAESEYIVLFSVPNYTGLRCPYRILWTVYASDISCACNRGNVPSRR